MRAGRAIALWLGVCLGLSGSSLAAQDCPGVARLVPNTRVTGAIDATSCQLGDRTPYAAYRIDLPVRGQIRIELAGNTSDFSLILRDASGIRVDSGIAVLRPIEAGSYTLLVNGRSPGQTGSFALNTSFTSEPGILCANFPNIGRDQPVE